jgi:hypothetical protein
MVELPQQTVPTSNETAITSEPNLSRRLYGPATPIGSGSPPSGPQTLYTVPVGKRATITMLLVANVDDSSPFETKTFTLSIGPDALDTRIFNNSEVDPGIPLALGLDLTLEEGEIVQGLPAPGVTITISGREFDA